MLINLHIQLKINILKLLYGFVDRIKLYFNKKKEN